MQIGASAIDKLYVGSTEATKAYLGANLVYDATPVFSGTRTFDDTDVNTAAPNATTSANVKHIDKVWVNEVGAGSTQYESSAGRIPNPVPPVDDFHRLTSTNQAFKAGGAYVFAWEMTSSYIYPDLTLLNNLEQTQNGILVTIRSQEASASTLVGLDIVIKNGGVTCTISTPNNYNGPPRKLIIVIPSTGTPYCFFQNVKYTGNVAINGMGANTDAMYFPNSLTTPSPYLGYHGSLSKVVMLSGDITNSDASLSGWDGTPEFFTGSHTVLVDSPNGWPEGQQGFHPTSDVPGTVPGVSGTGAATTNNFIPYFITPTANLDASTLVLDNTREEAATNLTTADYNVKYSTDGGATLSALYTGAAFAALGILTATIDVIYIQPIGYNGVKSGSIST